MFDFPSITFVDLVETIVRISDLSGLILFKTTRRSVYNYGFGTTVIVYIDV